MMLKDFNKPTQVHNTDADNQKKRTPVYILIIVALFLVAFLVYMLADWA